MSITREFLRRPVLTGAIAASSGQLARVMTAGLGIEDASLIVELGPGTGVFTEAILDRLAPGARLVAFELNPLLAARLAERYQGRPVEVVHAAAADLRRYIDAPVDAVVSGLPWTVMPERDQRDTLDAVTGCLAGTGRFATFAYAHAAWTPPARRFARLLADRFTTVRRSSIVWPNLPPAFVHQALDPRPDRSADTGDRDRVGLLAAGR